MLQDCPLCKLVEKSSHKETPCVVVVYDGKKAVVLRDHEPAPSTVALKEAVRMIEGYVGSDIREVPGHWGMVATKIDWLQKPAARYGDGNKSQS